MNSIIHPGSGLLAVYREIRSEVRRRHEDEKKRSGVFGQIVFWFQIEREIARELKKRFPTEALYISGGELRANQAAAARHRSVLTTLRRMA